MITLTKVSIQFSLGLIGRHPIEEAAVDGCIETTTDLRVSVMHVHIKDIRRHIKVCISIFAGRQSNTINQMLYFL